MAYSSAPHPRLSILSTSSQSSLDHHLSPTPSSTRFSLSSAPSINTTLGGAPAAKSSGSRPNIYDRNINKTRNAEVSLSAFAFLFSEMVQYTQKRVNGINDLERRLNTLGYRVGTRVLELLFWRNEASSKTPKREIRLVPVLMLMLNQVWKAVFSKAADALEKSVENADEYMIIDNDPPIERYITVPRDLSQLSCSSFTAGIVEAVLDGLGFRVTGDMVKINSIDITPPLINSSCAWSSTLEQLQELYKCSYTGGVVTRTATTEGFKEDDTHTVKFHKEHHSCLNSFGYSPHPLSLYLSWIPVLLASMPPPSAPHPYKPIIVSIAASTTATLSSMISSIQNLRAAVNDCSGAHPARIAIEFNTSCPNIPGVPPSGYDFKRLEQLLRVLSEAFHRDNTLTIGLKLPPFVVREQFLSVIDGLKETIQPLSGENCTSAVLPGHGLPYFHDNKSGKMDGHLMTQKSPISFITCTNTLGNVLYFPEQVLDVSNRRILAEKVDPESGVQTMAGKVEELYALPTPLGGMAGEALHPLALGNVYAFAQLLHHTGMKKSLKKMPVPMSTTTSGAGTGEIAASIGVGIEAGVPGKITSSIAAPPPSEASGTSSPDSAGSPTNDEESDGSSTPSAGSQDYGGSEGESPISKIVIIGVGGVVSPDARRRMEKAGAGVIGAATLLGKMGVKAFEYLTTGDKRLLKDYMGTGSPEAAGGSFEPGLSQVKPTATDGCV